MSRSEILVVQGTLPLHVITVQLTEGSFTNHFGGPNWTAAAPMLLYKLMLETGNLYESFRRSKLACRRAFVAL